MKDYYSILGLQDSATSEQIKRAYYRLAKELHPDVNPTNKAAKKFLDVREAVDTLLDPKQKLTYDLRRKGEAYNALYTKFTSTNNDSPESASERYRAKYEGVNEERFSHAQGEFHRSSFGRNMNILVRGLFIAMVLSGIFFSVLPFATFLMNRLSINTSIEMTIFCEALAFACIVQGVAGFKSNLLKQSNTKKEN